MSINKPDEVVSVEYTKGTSRIRKSYKDRKHNDQKQKRQMEKKYT